MTRRGSLVYYLTAWVIGCFVFSLGPWIRAMQAFNSGISRNLLLVYFITLIAGAPDVLIFAFLLRAIMKWSRARTLLVWVVEGAILAFAMTYLLAWAEQASRRVPSFDQGALHVIYQFFLAAPRVLQESRPLIVTAAGGVVGVVLYLVDRAFAPEEVTPEENPRA